MNRTFITSALIAIAALASHPFQTNAEESMQALTDRVFRLVSILTKDVKIDRE